MGWTQQELEREPLEAQLVWHLQQLGRDSVGLAGWDKCKERKQESEDGAEQSWLDIVGSQREQGLPLEQ